MARSYRPNVGVGVALVVVFQFFGAETSAFSTAGCPRSTDANAAAARLPSLLARTAASSSVKLVSHRNNHRWCRVNVMGPTARTTYRTSCLRPRWCRLGLSAMADSSGGSKFSRDHQALAAGQREKSSSTNILQRLSTITSSRLPTAPRGAASQPPPPHLELLPSDPIERFSGASKRGRQLNIFGKVRSWGSQGSTNLAERADGPSSSLVDRLVSELRSRTSLLDPRNQHQHQQRFGSAVGRSMLHHQHQQQQSEAVDRGLRELSAAIVRVETKLSLDSSEASQLREALRMLRSEKEAYVREKASTAARMEAFSREYDVLHRRVAVAEAELGRRSGRLRKAEVDREKTQAALYVRAQQLATGFGMEKERFSREMQSAEAQQGTGGPATVAAEKHKIDRGYRERLRVLSDGLASTQLQLATLKFNRSKLAALEVEARKDLTTHVARLEAQLKQAGEGIEKEKTDMEKLLLNLSNALSGVDVQFTQSAGMTPSRETSRALRRAKQDFRLNQRSVKLLLEKQRQRYYATSSVVEEEAQRLKSKTNELVSLRAELIEREGKEKDLKSNVAVLGKRVSSLDHDLWKTRSALAHEQRLRHETQAALVKSEEEREKQTKNLWSELKATRDAATSTRRVYEGTVKQREDWRKAIEEEKRTKMEAAERAEASRAALTDEVRRNKRAAERRNRELAQLKKQVVVASRSLALSVEERVSETNRLQEKIDALKLEASRQ
ncbi:unnamed protein product, partial [Ectocarpus sp. 4 AP-2014]